MCTISGFSTSAHCLRYITVTIDVSTCLYISGDKRRSWRDTVLQSLLQRDKNILACRFLVPLKLLLACSGVLFIETLQDCGSLGPTLAIPALYDLLEVLNIIELISLKSLFYAFL